MASPKKGFMTIKECEPSSLKECSERISYSPVKNKETFIQRKIRLLNEESGEFHKSPLEKVNIKQNFSRVM